MPNCLGPGHNSDANLRISGQVEGLCRAHGGVPPEAPRHATNRPLYIPGHGNRRLIHPRVFGFGAKGSLAGCIRVRTREGRGHPTSPPPRWPALALTNPRRPRRRHAVQDFLHRTHVERHEPAGRQAGLRPLPPPGGPLPCPPHSSPVFQCSSVPSTCSSLPQGCG